MAGPGTALVTAGPAQVVEGSELLALGGEPSARKGAKYEAGISGSSVGEHFVA